MRKEKKYNYIYKTTCLVTDRFYIGLHSTNNLDDGYMGSGKRLWYSFKKYGKDKHNVEILEYFNTRKELKEREKEIVNEELLGEELCMNLALGGTGGILNEEHRISFHRGGQKALTNKINNNSELKHKRNKNIGDTIKKLHKGGKYEYKHLDWTGKKHSEESKVKMRKSKNNGSSNSQYGTIWITNESENKKINKNSLIPTGWRKGRIIKN